jgi:tetratricopeptide (TPR) repeat protein
VDAARKRDWAKLPEILDYVASKDRDEIYAGSLIRLLENCDSDAKWPAIVKALKNDPSPWVRARAAEALQSRLESDTVPALVAATRDDTRLVRIRAASSLASYPADYLEPADRESVKRAADEFVAHLKSRPDDGASFYNLGNFHMARREHEQAIACFETANKLQADLFAAHVNAALAYNAVGRNDKAEASLRQAIKLDATNAVANLNLGLLLGELGRVRDAEGAFRTALKTEPRNAVAAYNLAVIAGQDGRVDEAIELCARAAGAAPQEPKYAYTLAFYQQQKGRISDAVQTLRRLLASPPAYGAAYALLGELYERQGKRSDAAEVYRQASENRKLSEQERAQFAQRARAL